MKKNSENCMCAKEPSEKYTSRKGESENTESEMEVPEKEYSGKGQF